MAIKAGRVGVDPSQVTLSGYIKGGGVSPEVLTKEEAQRIYQTIAGMSAYLKTVDANSLYQKISDMVDYQVKLVSGQNIKRINGEDLLGSGNITVLTRNLADGIYQTIAGMSDYVLRSEIPDLDDVLTKTEAPGYDDILTRTQARSLYNYTAGTGIDITNNVISSTSSYYNGVFNVNASNLVTGGICIRRGDVCFIELARTGSTAFTVGTTQEIGTVPSELYPSAARNGVILATTSGVPMFYTISTTGIVSVRASSAIPTNTSLYAQIEYPA